MPNAVGTLVTGWDIYQGSQLKEIALEAANDLYVKPESIPVLQELIDANRHAALYFAQTRRTYYNFVQPVQPAGPEYCAVCAIGAAMVYRYMTRHESRIINLDRSLMKTIAADDSFRISNEVFDLRVYDSEGEYTRIYGLITEMNDTAGMTFEEIANLLEIIVRNSEARR